MHNPLIIDCHLHIGGINGFYCSDVSADALIANMDRLNIQIGCVSALYALFNDATLGNAEVAAAVSRYPGRFIGMLCVNPHYPREVQQQLDQFMHTGLFGQIKLHPQQHGVLADHPGYETVYEYANRHGLSVLIHTWESQQIQAFTNVAKKYSNSMFIMAHAGGTIPGILEGVATVKRYENMVLDITLSGNHVGTIEYMVNQVGADRVLFGSDAVFISQSAALARVLYAKISDEAKEKVLGLNMKRILQLA